MPLPRHQAGGGVEADPAGARQIDLRPGVQIGEIRRGAFRSVQGLHIGDELDKVAGDKARGVAEVAQQMHQQPGGIATGAFGLGQRLLRRPHTGLHAYNIGNAFGDEAVESDKLVDVAHFRARHAVDQHLQQGAGRIEAAERREFFRQHGIVGEGPVLGLRVQEEVERVDGRHVGDEVDRDVEVLDLVWEHDAGHEVALRVLQPVQEVRPRFDLQRIGQDRRARMRRRPQADRLGTQ